ncbi:hypothetical protein BGX21_007360 [Mortierella sp. AD011]|nr:hypothetical protein BGX21_007360 [Mortierella sp. AD011]
MNIHPLSFDQTDQPHHIPFHNSTNFTVGNTPSFNNKRRSLADLPFVPTKTIKTKEKRNSVSATSAGSVESYRQDETIESYSGRLGHPKSGSSISTISVIPSSASSRKMSLDPHSSPPTRKPSATKGVGKGAGGSTSSPKTFQCTGYPGCNMVFTRSEHLARHERKHTGEKPYKCIVPSCPRTFSRFDNMMQHTQTHGDRSKRDSLVAATGGASRSRSSSMHSTPLMAGRPRGGSSPGIFGRGYEDPLHRGLQNSPASSHMGNIVFSQQQQHRHPYSTHYQQQQQSQHYPSSAPIPVSSVLMMSRSNNSIGGSVHGGGSQPYLPVSGPGSSAPIIRTLKANSRSLPHLQPRSSHSSSTDGSSTGFHGFASNETEELRRRKSEVLLPSSSYSGARAAVAGHNSSQGVGLSMSSFQPGVSHSQSLSQIDSLTPLEQDRLNEHRRTAHALMHRMSASTGSMDQRTTFEYLDQNPAIAGHATPHSNAANRSGNVNPPFAQMHHLSDQLLLEHRKSLSELYDGRYSKRSSNDPTDMVIQPLPSRDSRSGVQWFSQVSTPVNSSTGQVLSTSMGSQGGLGEGGDSVNVLPPILGRHDRYDDDAEQRHDRLPRPRSHSSNVHPLSRPSSSQFDHLGQPLWPLNDDSAARDRIHFDPTLSPRLERHLEERFYPIQKGEVLDVIGRMDTREFLGLKAQVAESFANDQFRNPEFLSNMTAVLCVIRAPHPAWKNPDARRSSSDNGTATSKRSLKDMDVDRVGDSERGNGSMHAESMDVDDRQTPVNNQDHSIDRKLHNVEQPCRYALDIDMDSYGRDPEPDLRALEGLTINSLFPTKSFVAGFEPVMEKQKQGENEEGNDADEDETPRSLRGYPSNARLGRFYLPERAFRTPESLAVQPDSNGPWICCQFEEYRGISIWVLESVLEKYHELSRKHKMALTLVGAPVYHRIATYDHDEWEIHTGEPYDVKVKESMLFPDMIQQVWKDIHHRYYQQQQQQHQHQHQHHQQQLPLNLSSMQQQGGYQPPNQVATYEEYQKSQVRGGHSYPHGYSHPKSRSLSSVGLDYYYNDYRHQQQSMHREDLSSAPSSPTSPPHDDFQEDSQTNELETSTPQQQDFLNTNANMHRRISIAELCNPMQSLATERERHSQSS